MKTDKDEAPKGIISLILVYLKAKPRETELPIFHMRLFCDLSLHKEYIPTL